MCRVLVLLEILSQRYCNPCCVSQVQGHSVQIGTVFLTACLEQVQLRVVLAQMPHAIETHCHLCCVPDVVAASIVVGSVAQMPLHPQVALYLTW